MMSGESSISPFKLADRQGYLLARSHAAACRLNLQYYLWKDSLKFNIHPSIPIVKKCAVADVATGTGLWLVDVAGELPEAQLDGFDIDLTQAPHQDWLPTNVKLRHWNIFEDVPGNLIEKYDIVHVRLLVMVIEDGNALPVIKNLLKMLKPGGHLQWDELNCVDLSVRTVEPAPSAPAIEQLRKMSYADGRHNWTLSIPDNMAREGFEDVQLYKFTDRVELARAMNELHLLLFEEFASGLSRIDKHEQAAQMLKLIEEAYKESINGTALCFPRIVCVGRKPKADA